MAETIDDLTVNYEEDGVMLTKELDKVILTRGAWTTIIFRFVQWDPKKDAYSPDRYAIRRYRLLLPHGSYTPAAVKEFIKLLKTSD